MPNVLADCAEAVKAALNDADPWPFSQEFECEWSYADWELPLEENRRKGLLVEAVPVSQLSTDPETQGSLKYGPSIDVVVRVYLGPERRAPDGRYNVEEINQYTQLVQDINSFFSFDRFGDNEVFAWDSETGTKIFAAYKPSHLREHHQFTGIVRVPFRCSVIMG